MKTIFLILVISIVSFGQTEKDTSENSSSTLETIGEGVVSAFKISGEAGAYGEFYTISGREQRRKPTTGRIFFRPVITLLDNFSISFDIFLSTEGNSAQQQISTLSLHPTWGWSKWHIGDFSHELSKFTLSGLNIRGGGIELYPGWLRFQILGGRSQRATNLGPQGSTYDRYVAAGKLGIGSETSYFDINIVRSKDDISSLPRDIFREIVTTTLPDSSIKVDTQFVGTTPQENLVLGVATAFSLFNGKIRYKGEAAGSIFTRDLTSNQVDQKELKDLPSGFDKVYSMRLSTSADYAFFGDLGFNLGLINARFSYMEIGPGYTSMGIPSVINDKKAINGGVGFNFFSGAWSIQGTYANQKDNLAKQKIFTSDRTTYGISTSVRPWQIINISTSYMLNLMTNDAKNDTLKLDNKNVSINTNLSIQLKAFGLQHNLSTSLGQQLSQNNNILRKGNDVTANSVSLSISTVLSQQWNISLGGTFNSVEMQNKDTKITTGANLRVSNKSLGNKLNSSLTYSLSNSSASNVHSIIVSSSYPVTVNSSISFNARSMIFQGKDAATANYFETTSSLGYNYRF